MSGEHRHTSSLDAALKIAADLKLIGQTLAKVASRILSAKGIEEVASAMNGAADVLRRVEEVSAVFHPISREVQVNAEAALSELEADLRDALRTKGWQCDGQWPNFIVERALEVKIDESSRAAHVVGRKVPVASAKAIVEALTPEINGLLPKGFDSRNFLEQIALAYDATRGPMPTVPIFDVYRGYVIAQQKPKFWRNAVEDRFEGVSADQFRARLTKSLEEGHIVSKDGRALRLLPPLDPKDALFVYQPAEARFAFVGRVEFVKET
jgi:hypothetical protein